MMVYNKYTVLLPYSMYRVCNSIYYDNTSITSIKNFMQYSLTFMIITQEFLNDIIIMLLLEIYINLNIWI